MSLNVPNFISFCLAQHEWAIPIWPILQRWHAQMSTNTEIEIRSGEHHINSHEDEPQELVDSEDEDDCM